MAVLCMSDLHVPFNVHEYTPIQALKHTETSLPSLNQDIGITESVWTTPTQVWLVKS